MPGTVVGVVSKDGARVYPFAFQFELGSGVPVDYLGTVRSLRRLLAEESMGYSKRSAAKAANTMMASIRHNNKRFE